MWSCGANHWYGRERSYSRSHFFCRRITRSLSHGGRNAVCLQSPEEMRHFSSTADEVLLTFYRSAKVLRAVGLFAESTRSGLFPCGVTSPVLSSNGGGLQQIQSEQGGL